jgi:hypothetical protein
MNPLVSLRAWLACAAVGLAVGTLLGGSKRIVTGLFGGASNSLLDRHTDRQHGPGGD